MYKQYKNNITQNYLLDSSPWPLVASLGALFITFGGVMYMHLYKNGLFFLIGLFTIIHIMYCCWRDIFCGLYFDFYIKPRRSFWMSRVLLLIFKIANNLVNYVLIYGQSNFWEPILFFSYKKKTNKDSLIDSQNLKKNGGELTFKNRAFYFKNNRLPEILSLNNCKDLAESLQLLDEPSFNRFVQYSYSKKESKTIFMFINSLRLKGILDEFILFFITKKNLTLLNLIQFLHIQVLYLCVDYL